LLGMAANDRKCAFDAPLGFSEVLLLAGYSGIDAAARDIARSVPETITILMDFFGLIDLSMLL